MLHILEAVPEFYWKGCLKYFSSMCISYHILKWFDFILEVLFNFTEFHLIRKKYCLNWKPIIVIFMDLFTYKVYFFIIIIIKKYFSSILK